MSHNVNDFFVFELWRLTLKKGLNQCDAPGMKHSDFLFKKLLIIIYVFISKEKKQYVL